MTGTNVELIFKGVQISEDKLVEIIECNKSKFDIKNIGNNFLEKGGNPINLVISECCDICDLPMVIPGYKCKKCNWIICIRCIKNVYKYSKYKKILNLKLNLNHNIVRKIFTSILITSEFYDRQIEHLTYRAYKKEFGGIFYGCDIRDIVEDYRRNYDENKFTKFLRNKFKISFESLYNFLKNTVDNKVCPHCKNNLEKYYYHIKKMAPHLELIDIDNNLKLFTFDINKTDVLNFIENFDDSYDSDDSEEYYEIIDDSLNIYFLIVGDIMVYESGEEIPYNKDNFSKINNYYKGYNDEVILGNNIEYYVSKDIENTYNKLESLGIKNCRINWIKYFDGWMTPSRFEGISSLFCKKFNIKKEYQYDMDKLEQMNDHILNNRVNK